VGYQIELRTLPRRELAVVRFRASVAEIGQKIGPAFGLVQQYLAGAGIPIEGPAVAMYQPSEDGFAVSAGFVVPTTIPGDGKVMPAELPACQAAVTTHLGSYADLPVAYAAVQSWMAETDREPGEVMWEEYWSDATAPAETTRTDVFWPVKGS
jgi:effector-binding domain-containing protein